MSLLWYPFDVQSRPIPPQVLYNASQADVMSSRPFGVYPIRRASCRWATDVRVPINAPGAPLLQWLHHSTVCDCLPGLALDDQAIYLEELSDNGLPLEDLEVLQALLNQLLDPARVVHRPVVAEGISRPPLRVLSVVIGGELLALP